MMNFLYCCILLLLSTALNGEDPWGQDAILLHPLKKNSTFEETFALRLIRFHQEVISPADGPRSHYFPSSSQYTKEAILKYGFIQGFLMGCDRLMRENDAPWIYKKYHGGPVTLKYNPVR